MASGEHGSLAAEAEAAGEAGVLATSDGSETACAGTEPGIEVRVTAPVLSGLHSESERTTEPLALAGDGGDGDCAGGTLEWAATTSASCSTGSSCGLRAWKREY